MGYWTARSRPSPDRIAGLPVASCSGHGAGRTWAHHQRDQHVRPGSASYSASDFERWGLTQIIALEGRTRRVSRAAVWAQGTSA